MSALKYVKLTDAEGLREVGCPWKPKTLLIYHSQGKYPNLFAKIGKRVVLVVEELERMLQEGKGK